MHYTQDIMVHTKRQMYIINGPLRKKKQTMTEDTNKPNLDQSNYPSNSHKSKQETPEEPKPDPSKKVINTEVRRGKKTFGDKFKEVFIGEDAQSVGSYILFDIAIPAFKNFIYDSLTQGAEQTLFGRGNGGRSSSRSGGSNYPSGRSGYTAYNKMYRDDRRGEDPYDRHIDRRARSTHDFDTIIIETRGEAEAVLDRLTFTIDEYDVAKVADLYDAVGITPSFQDNKWGWTNLSQASVRRARGGGYMLNLPRPEAI